jgi:ACS family glucarate transporter-like MFS transporter
MVVAAVGLGSAIAPPLMWFAMVRWGWRVALMVSSLPALALGCAWMSIRQPAVLPAEPATGGGPAAAPPEPPQRRNFILLTMSYSLQGYVGYIFVFWFYLYLVDVRHFDLLRGALFSSLPWLLSIVSIPLGGWLFDRLPCDRRTIPIAGLAGSGLFIALGAHTQYPYLAAVCMAFATALVLSVEGPFWATMTVVAGARSGTGGGIMNMGCNIGGMISPALTPVLAASIGWEAALMVSAALAVVAALLWYGIRPPAANPSFGSSRTAPLGKQPVEVEDAHLLDADAGNV